MRRAAHVADRGTPDRSRHPARAGAAADGVPSFVEVAAATDNELHALSQTLITRRMKLLTRRGVLSRISRARLRKRVFSYDMT